MTKRLITLLGIIISIQSMAYSQTDTIRNRHKHYYYSAWYDSCYAAGNTISYTSPLETTCERIYAAYQYTEQPLEIIGIAVGVMNTKFQDTTRVPEYVMLVEGWSDSLQYALIDSVRWDTATPKIMGLDYRRYDEYYDVVDTIDGIPIYDSFYDTIEGEVYIEICEAYFKSPITVYDSFYLGRTCFNNIPADSDVPEYPDQQGFIHQATIYHGSIHVSYCKHYSPDIWSEDFGATWGTVYPATSPEDYYNNTNFYNLIFPIIRVYDTLSVVGMAFDTLQGYVQGSGSYIEKTMVTLTAVPHEGYKFVMWNDSVTTNPRTFSVTQDTTFTAYFAPADEYNVEVYVDDLKRGTVQGSGVYYEQSAVTISAQANEGYHFQCWNDSIATNPRTFVLTQDTTFTAHFGEGDDTTTTGISAAEAKANLFALSPNPTSNNLQINIHQPGSYTMAIYTAKGVEVRKQEISQSGTIDVSELVPGTYVVKIYNDRYTGVKTFVKQ